MDRDDPQHDLWKGVANPMARNESRTIRSEVLLERARARLFDPTPYLDGTVKPPTPSVGAENLDGLHALYPRRWHNVVGPTETGKSWYALHHVRAELLQSNTVVYVHFEEGDPSGTYARLLALGVPKQAIRDQFKFLDGTMRFDPGLFAAILSLVVEQSASVPLVVLDGVLAACSIQGWDPTRPEGVGSYVSELVSPARSRGAAVLSLGHPVKSADRQWERYSFGSGDWLNLLDGVAYRLVPGKVPITRGMNGSAKLFIVKDRDGQVKVHGAPNQDHDGWTWMGSFHVDNDRDDGTVLAYVTSLDPNEAGRRQVHAMDKYDRLGEQIVKSLAKLPSRTAVSQNALIDQVRADGGGGRTSDYGPAIVRLVDRGVAEYTVGTNNAKSIRLKGAGGSLDRGTTEGATGDVPGPEVGQGGDSRDSHPRTGTGSHLSGGGSQDRGTTREPPGNSAAHEPGPVQTRTDNFTPSHLIAFQDFGAYRRQRRDSLCRLRRWKPPGPTGAQEMMSTR